jgi:hypothetical protein
MREKCVSPLGARADHGRTSVCPPSDPNALFQRLLVSKMDQPTLNLICSNSTIQCVGCAKSLVQQNVGTNSYAVASVDQFWFAICSA